MPSLMVSLAATDFFNTIMEKDFPGMVNSFNTVHCWVKGDAIVLYKVNVALRVIFN